MPIKGHDAMENYFNSDHFNLLSQWEGKAFEKSSAEHQLAYEELKKAYQITEAWAKEVCKKLFPNGWVEVRKRPTNQGNNFSGYNWAKIYPERRSPKELAYTVGIDSDNGFVVKIDTVGLAENDARHMLYRNIRDRVGEKSPIVAILPADNGLKLDFSGLVDWSVKSILDFGYSYQEVAKKMGLIMDAGSEEILAHFQGYSEFTDRQPHWSPETTALFVRLARAVHKAGLDWWFTKATNSQLRFGRKEKGKKKGRPVGWIFLMQGGGLRVSWSDIDPIEAISEKSIEDELVSAFESLKQEDILTWPDKLRPVIQREGFWPDAYDEDEIAVLDELYDKPGFIQATPPTNQIFFGPPGTGKTYRLRQLIQEKGYEAELAKISEKEWLCVNLVDAPWWAVIFLVLRDLDKPVKVDEILNHAYFKAKAGLNSANKSLRATVWNSLQSHTVEASATVKTDIKSRTAPFIFNKSEQGLWYLSGDWIESCAHWVDRAVKIANGQTTQDGLIKRYEFVTFHQSYSYEDFIEGIRPQPGEEGQGVSYNVMPGVFRRLCERARQDPAHRYAIFIDEINRGNISKIFGELITLIEVDKRTEYDVQGNLIQGMEVTLPYSGDSFGVPRNLDIYGSMNTADRSIALLDTALRRRFKFHELMPDPEAVPGNTDDGYIPDGEGGLIDLRALMKALNRRIAYLLNRDQMIGHAFFCKVRDIHELRSMLCDEIIPLLQEYFYNDWQRIRMVFGYNNQTTGFQIISQEAESAEQVFGWADDEQADSFRYRICHPDEITAEAIRRIIGPAA
jgi:5-methylcytosine-specific restriction protein B